MKKRLGVMVAVPTMTNRITIQVASLIDALRQSALDPEIGFDVHYVIEMGKAPVEYARNLLCGHFLKSDCDKLWFIDEDMMPETTAVRLLKHDADIVAARMYKFDHPNAETGRDVGLGLCAMNRAENGLYKPLLPEIGDEALQDVDAVGTGCTVIARHVIEDRRLWSDNVYTTADGQTFDGNAMPAHGDYAPAIFRHPRAASGMGIMGEDVDFCARAKALGYSIKVDLNAVCGHFKSIDIDQAGFLAQKTVERVFRGLKMEDGRVLKVDLTNAIKAVEMPTSDKAVHEGDFATKAVI